MRLHYRFGIDSPDDLPAALRDYAYCKEIAYEVFADGSIFAEHDDGVLIVEGGGVEYRGWGIGDGVSVKVRSPMKLGRVSTAC